MNIPFFFLQIRINFLHVGHTHADCDQMFSKILQRVLKHGAESMNGKLYTVASTFNGSLLVAHHKFITCFKLHNKDLQHHNPLHWN